MQLLASDLHSTGQIQYQAHTTHSPPRHSPRSNYPSLPRSRSMTMNHTPISGYRAVSQKFAKRVVHTLLTSTNMKEKREEHINQRRKLQQRGQADVFIDLNECVEIAGEKSSAFVEIVRQLEIFDENTRGDTFVMYKKVPRTASQSKSNQPECEEDVLTYLSSRWMEVDADSMKWIQYESTDRTFRVWKSLRYLNHNLIYCQAFVINTEINRHVFHKEFLDNIVDISTPSRSASAISAFMRSDSVFSLNSMVEELTIGAGITEI